MTAPPCPEDVAIPWRSPRAWARALRALRHVISSRGDALGEAERLASGVQVHLRGLFPRLDTLCRDTCPWCPDPCCAHAAVYADFRDLLLFALARTGHPPVQLRSCSTDPCRFLTPRGCALPRIQRPWICTWYLCATQRSALARWTEQDRNDLLDHLDRIRRERRRMEEKFLRAVT